MGEYLAADGVAEIATTVGVDLYVALAGHVVFLVLFVGWALYANRKENRVENSSTSTDDRSTPIDERSPSTDDRSTSAEGDR